MRYISLLTKLIAASVMVSIILGGGASADSVTVSDIVALKEQYSAENNPGNTNGPDYDMARSITIKSPLFVHGEHTIYRSSTSTNNDVDLKCGTKQLAAQLLTDEATWKSLDRNKRPDAIRYGLYLSGNNSSAIVSEDCPNLIDGIAAGMEGKAQLPEKAKNETQNQLNDALYLGAGRIMAQNEVLNDFRDDPSTFARWCATSSRGVSCSEEAWQKILGECSVTARGRAADAARYMRPAPSEAQLKTMRQEAFGRCLSQKLYGNDSKSSAISNKLKSDSIDPMTAAVAGSEAKAKEAKDMLEGLKSNINDITNVGGEETASPCQIDGVGWIVCPIMNFMAVVSDSAYSVIEGFLQVNTELMNTKGGTYVAWSSFRNIANVAFIVVFLAVIYSQITNAGISNYGIKRVLPRLAIAAILVNLSFILCQLAVDVTQIIGSSLKDLLGSIETAKETVSWSVTIGDALAGGVILGTALAGLAIGVAVIATSISLPVLLIAALSLLMTVVILIGRQAAIVILTTISPLAFVAYILPNTENLFKRWLKIFGGLLMVYPIISLLYGGGALASRIIVNSSGGDFWMSITALGVAAIPLVMTPSLLRGSLNATGALGAKLSGWGQRASSGVIKTAKTSSRFGEASQGIKNRFALGRATRRTKSKLAREIDQSTTGRFLGLDRGAARAVSLVDEEEERAVKSAGIMLAGQTHKELKSLVTTGVDKNGAKASKAQITAAIDSVMSSGGFGDRRGMLEYVAALPESERALKQRVVKAAYAKGDQSIYGVEFGDKIVDGTIRSGKDLANEAVKNAASGRLQAEHLAGSSSGSVWLNSQINSTANPEIQQQARSNFVSVATTARTTPQTAARLDGNLNELFDSLGIPNTSESSSAQQPESSSAQQPESSSAQQPESTPIKNQQNLNPQPGGLSAPTLPGRTQTVQGSGRQVSNSQGPQIIIPTAAETQAAMDDFDSESELRIRRGPR